MKFLDYIQLANKFKPELTGSAFNIGLVTNFTDDVLAKILVGVCLQNKIQPSLYKVPYKQYGFALKDLEHPLWQPRQLFVFFFDINYYIRSEFFDGDDYTNSLLADLENFIIKTSGTVVVNTFLFPYNGPLSNQVLNQELFLRVQRTNARLFELAKKYSNCEVFEINRIAQLMGEQNIRDLRGLYAFDAPFTNDFLTKLAEEWMAYVLALSGKTKKVIILDLDNTLWGGVVGELGPTQILVGPGYPGVAFQNFQRALLEYKKNGILLAINSKNNSVDVEEVFEKNPHMVLKKEDFVAIKANWEDKVTNLITLAKELNLSLESFVFIDDDPLQREFVSSRLPEVLVPELSKEPEQYIDMLYSLAIFNPFAVTLEDLGKQQQYAEEQERKHLEQAVTSLEDFVSNLNIVLDIFTNHDKHVPRVSQLTLKTNQFNVTTRRYGQKEIEDLMKQGNIFSANVRDKFGDYGLTALAIVLPDVSTENGFILDSFLMSCRVLGRTVEYSFLDHIIKYIHLHKQAKFLKAEFVPTAKNDPAKDFFVKFGMKPVDSVSNGQRFELDIEDYIKKENLKISKSIITNQL